MKAVIVAILCKTKMKTLSEGLRKWVFYDFFHFSAG